MVYSLSAALPCRRAVGVSSGHRISTIYNIFDNTPLRRRYASDVCTLILSSTGECCGGAEVKPDRSAHATRLPFRGSALTSSAVSSCRTSACEWNVCVNAMDGRKPYPGGADASGGGGLVELEQNRGFKVSEVSPRKLADLMRTRIEIESIALRWSLEKGGLEWEAALISSFHRLSKRTKLSQLKIPAPSVRSGSRSTPIFMPLCWRHVIPESLLLICLRLFEQAERYVTLSIISNGPRRDDVSEHKQLMRAALSRDVSRTLELNRAHINRTLGKAAAWLAAHPAPVNLRLLDRKAK